MWKTRKRSDASLMMEGVNSPREITMIISGKKNPVDKIILDAVDYDVNSAIPWHLVLEYANESGDPLADVQMCDYIENKIVSQWGTLEHDYKKHLTEPAQGVISIIDYPKGIEDAVRSMRGFCYGKKE